MGLGRTVHQEQLEAGLPADLAGEFHRLTEWARTLPERFGNRVTLRLVDVASIEGFFKSLIHRVNRYPAFVVDRKRYMGDDFTRVDALISQSLDAEEALRGADDS
jgi:hypothetical protein